ncbi:unnamed protein product [Calypogeia fissa]
MAGTQSICLSLTVSSTVSARADISSNSQPHAWSTGVSDTFCQRTWTGGGTRRTHGLIPKPFAAPAKAYKFGRKFLVSCANKSPDDFPAEGKDDESEEGQFVAPRVTPDYVGKDSINPPPRVVKNIEGPWITRWGGNVRGGKYQMGQGTDRIIDIFANGNAMLIAAGGLIVLFFVLLQFRPDAPPPPPPS